LFTGNSRRDRCSATFTLMETAFVVQLRQIVKRHKFIDGCLPGAMRIKVNIAVTSQVPLLIRKIIIGSIKRPEA
jgi:hypothetical protein